MLLSLDFDLGYLGGLNLVSIPREWSIVHATTAGQSCIKEITQRFTISSSRESLWEVRYSEPLAWKGILIISLPSKHAGSDSHPDRIGLEVLARSGPDVSYTPVWFRTGSVWPKPDTISQN